jgi:hypothetical protein
MAWGMGHAGAMAVGSMGVYGDDIIFNFYQRQVILFLFFDINSYCDIFITIQSVRKFHPIFPGHKAPILKLSTCFFSFFPSEVIFILTYPLSWAYGPYLITDISKGHTHFL